MPAESRLFTYIVAHDAGSAPNPFGGICSLALCKPMIRRVAKAGDWVVGFASAAEKESRIVYCMQVEHSLPWAEYKSVCKGIRAPPPGYPTKTLLTRVPKNQHDPGDCIWGSDSRIPLPSLSGHTHNEYGADVERGLNVLLSRHYWYFGDGARHRICLPDSLQELVPGRGHQSVKNTPYISSFHYIFNNLLRERRVEPPGVHGEPKLRLETSTHAERSRCRQAQSEDDEYEEDYDEPATQRMTNR